jgi:hypothetical protein
VESRPPTTSYAKASASAQGHAERSHSCGRWGDDYRPLQAQPRCVRLLKDLDRVHGASKNTYYADTLLLWGKNAAAATRDAQQASARRLDEARQWIDEMED